MNKAELISAIAAEESIPIFPGDIVYCFNY